MESQKGKMTVQKREMRKQDRKVFLVAGYILFSLGVIFIVITTIVRVVKFADWTGARCFKEFWMAYAWGSILALAGAVFLRKADNMGPWPRR